LSAAEYEGKGILRAAVGAILLGPVPLEPTPQNKNFLGRESHWSVFGTTFIHH